MKEVLIDEIYKYVNSLDLSDEELKHIDTYVNDLIQYLEPIMAIQNNVVSIDELFNEFKKMVKEQLGE
jgi:hypothetical protein